MKVLFDFNNLACRCTYREKAGHDGQPQWNRVAFSMFDEAFSFLRGVREFLDIGEALETVFAYDSVNGYWRGDLYPPYKADRDITRERSDLDWDAARREFAVIAKLLAQATPWKVLQVDKCEADDIIFTLANEDDDSTIIYSGDCDYLQLVNDHVSVYVPHHGDFAEFPRVCRIGGGEAYCETPEIYLQYAILTGQGGKDNVYNVKTPSNWDCSKRKPGFGVAAAKKVLNSPAGLLDELARMGLLNNFRRNQELIDMRFLPERYCAQIRQTWKAAEKHAPDMDAFRAYYNWQPAGFDVDRVNNELGIISGVFAPDNNNFVYSDNSDAEEFAL